MNIYILASTHLKDRDTCLNWLREKDLPPINRKCPNCKRPMTYEADHGLGRYRCRNSHSGKGDINISVAKGTWFENVKAGVIKSVLLVYAFTSQMTYEQTIKKTTIDGSVTSSTTVADWFNYCREVCMCALDQKYENEGMIGGEGVVVEIDESLVGKMKYWKGRLRKGNWILGMVERGKDRNGYRLELRNADTLIPLIQKHVAPGTTIITDEWRAYLSLEKYGYKHLTVNHSKHFKDPVTGAHTNTIEGSWKWMKYKLTTRGYRRDQLAMHLCEYLWFRDCRRNNIDPFDQMIKDIKNVCPTNTCNF
ncbi:uncharacterized protein LOC128954341 [Oppia nitens]|uniref:uncharacterized protein LOC128954341 n=1 Tax=Oppia nitens TaxID=1686743 RepID=UPI0023DB94AA|nr:uncharacterized protein LOC128954341 [Oppia nitens]